MKRRTFLGTAPLGVLALGAGPVAPMLAASATPTPGRRTGAMPDEPAGWQHLHADAQTDLGGAEHFFLGNGEVVAVIRHASGAALDAGQTPLGLMFWDPAQFARTWSTYPFHPEWGLKRGIVSVVAEGKGYAADPASLAVVRERVEGVPVVVARWMAGPHRVEERFWVAGEAPVLYREVTVTNGSAAPAALAVATAHYYSHALFTDYRTDHAAGVLRADGYAHAELSATPAPTLSDRYLRTELGSVAPGAMATARLAYTIRTPAGPVTDAARTAHWASAVAQMQRRATVETGEPALDHLFAAARDGIRAAVSRAGRFDASVFQYNMEWVMDSSGVLAAASMTGQHALAASVLDNLCTRLVNEKGICAHASRFHDDLSTELNQQGALLGAAWLYRAWTGDLDRIRRHWPVLQKVAAFALDPRFLHPSGLVQSTIELFERDANSGLEPGFDVTHQACIAWGLEKAALLAREVGDADSAAAWSAAGRRMREAMLRHPTLALVDDGVLIKRRLPDGRRQATLRTRASVPDHMPAGTPLGDAQNVAPPLDPDIGTLWPLLLGQVPAASPLAQRTLDTIAPLWNAAAGGGYLRYNPAADPDAPGSWTFPTAIVGRVMASAGRPADLRRILGWFTSVQGARGGAYYEFYARTPRPVPPLPPMGFIVWGWAELAQLFVEGLVGARLDARGEGLVFRPCLPEGLDHLTARLRFRDAWLDITVQRTGQLAGRLDGRPLAVTPEGVVLAAPVGGGRLDLET